jgi:hypothetical protein
MTTPQIIALLMPAPLSSPGSCGYSCAARGRAERIKAANGQRQPGADLWLPKIALFHSNVGPEPRKLSSGRLSGAAALPIRHLTFRYLGGAHPLHLGFDKKLFLYRVKMFC